MVQSFEPLGGKKDSSSDGQNKPVDEASKETSKEEKTEKSDFGGFLWELVKSIPYKMALFVFILFIVINSTIFIENFVGPFGNSYIAGQVTDKGIYLQGMFLAIGYIVIHSLVASGIV